MHSSREVAGTGMVLMGVLYAATALVANPAAVGLLSPQLAIDHGDVLWSYCRAAVIAGVSLVLIGRQLSRSKGARVAGLALVSMVLAPIVLFDRALLAALGLPLWVHDADLVYRNRPNKEVSLSWVGRPDAIVRINSRGFHDDEFPTQKPDGEFRALLLGDSITMGDGVVASETFAAELERRLEDAGTGFTSHQVINAGVNGYSTFQELRVLRDNLDLSPDFVALGFCMNDVTEPFVNNRDFGGVGLDYHGVVQTNTRFGSYLFNETGYGRLSQKLRQRNASKAAEKRKEVYGVRAMALEGRANPRFDEAWSIVLTDMRAVVETVEAARIPFVLMVFPFTFQLSDADARDPQRLLAEFASQHNVPIIDFTPIFEKLVFDDSELLRTMRERGYSNEEIEAYHFVKLRKYFRDADHLTPAGHAVVARELEQHLRDRGLLHGPGAQARALAPAGSGSGGSP